MNTEENPYLVRARNHFKNDKVGRAKRIAERVLKGNPGMPEALELLAAIDMHRGHFITAIPLLEKASGTEKKNPETMARLGFCYHITRQIDEALEAFKSALKVEPGQFESLFGVASIYIVKGELEQAQIYLEKAIDAPSKNLEGYRLLATLTPLVKDKKFLQRMLDLVPMVNDFAAIEQAHLEFAIATVYQKQGNKEKFVEHLDRANAHLKKEAKPWREANQIALDLSKEVFTEEIIKAGNSSKAKKFTAIFIVGLPRSGSTMLEQILASHSKVFGADETPFIRRLFVEDMTRHFGKIYPKFVPEMSAEEKLGLAESYQNRVQALSPKSPFIIDKMVGNSFLIGMIKLILPWAKVIHIKRHPADTALSMYSNYFAPAISYANNLEELPKYFRMHVEYMDLWDKVCPGFVHHVRYEDLVANLEEESKKIIEFCGLEWEEACLDFHQTERTVMTLSAGQVRSKVYTSSIGKWKDYKETLKPFTDGVKDLLKGYGY